jgi:hypothetical protein
LSSTPVAQLHMGSASRRPVQTPGCCLSNNSPGIGCAATPVMLSIWSPPAARTRLLSELRGAAHDRERRARSYPAAAEPGINGASPRFTPWTELMRH